MALSLRLRQRRRLLVGPRPVMARCCRRRSALSQLSRPAACSRELPTSSLLQGAGRLPTQHSSPLQGAWVPPRLCKVPRTLGGRGLVVVELASRFDRGHSARSARDAAVQTSKMRVNVAAGFARSRQHALTAMHSTAIASTRQFQVEGLAQMETARQGARCSVLNCSVELSCGGRVAVLRCHGFGNNSGSCRCR